MARYFPLLFVAFAGLVSCSAPDPTAGYAYYPTNYGSYRSLYQRPSGASNNTLPQEPATSTERFTAPDGSTGTAAYGTPDVRPAYAAAPIASLPSPAINPSNYSTPTPPAYRSTATYTPAPPAVPAPSYTQAPSYKPAPVSPPLSYNPKLAAGSTYRPEIGSTYSSGSYYDSSYRPPVGDHYVQGYTRRDGTYVSGHYQTNPDNSFWNNYSSSGNTNPHTGRVGTVQAPSYTTTSGGTVQVRGYTRKDGTYVRPHTRRK